METQEGEMMAADSPFNVILAETRIQRGLTIVQCADRTGFTRGFIRSYEDVAINPTASTLFKFARALDLRFVIDAGGVAVVDTATDVLVLEGWVPNAKDKRW